MRTPVRVALLCSHRAPGLTYLLQEDSYRGVLYDIVCCLSSAQQGPPRAAAEAGVPCLTHPIAPFYAERGAGMSNLGVRAQYDSRTLDLLSGFRPDLIVLSSYLYVLTAPMLSAFPARILNVHHSDLSIKNGQGDPKYIGLRSVRDAILAGERETRATVHLVTQKLDGGPPVLRSWPFPVSPLVGDGLAMNASEMLKAYVFAHQEWMLRSSWGPLLARSIALLATDRVRFRGDTAWIDGVAGPWDLRPSDRGTMLIRPAHQMVLETGALSA